MLETRAILLEPAEEAEPEPAEDHG
jgi:hypothetical protein